MIFPNNKPMTARVAPKAKEPTSPIKILAGYTLKYKNEIIEPINNAKNIEIGISNIADDKNQSPKSEIISDPAAKPSRPSVILIAFAKETIVKVAKGM